MPPAASTTLPWWSTTATAARCRLSTWLPRVTSTSSGLAASASAALGGVSACMPAESLLRGTARRRSPHPPSSLPPRPRPCKFCRHARILCHRRRRHQQAYEPGQPDALGPCLRGELLLYHQIG